MVSYHAFRQIFTVLVGRFYDTMPPVHPILFEFGPLSLKTYGLLMATAMLVGIYLAKRRANVEGVDAKQIESISYWLIAMSLIGGRFLFTFGENTRYYLAHPHEFFYLHEGGISFLGSFYFAVPTLFILCRKRKLPFWQVVDIFVPTLALGLAIGKIGCFFAGCCNGKLCDLPWGVVYRDPQSLASIRNMPVHPTQIYESALWLTVYFCLVYFRRFRKSYGEVFLLFVAIFAISRPFLETMRAEPRYIGNLTTVPFLSVPLLIATVIAWWYLRRKPTV